MTDVAQKILQHPIKNQKQYLLKITGKKNILKIKYFTVIKWSFKNLSMLK